MTPCVKSTVLEHLNRIRFIGPFPGGIDTLLVPLDTALTEAQTVDATLTRKMLNNLLKTANVSVFNSIDDYAKYKGLKIK